MRHFTFAKPSAVPVWVPKKMVIFFFPSSISSGSTTDLGTTNFGGSRTFLADVEERRHIKTTAHPIKTATEVVNIIIKSLFSINKAANEAGEVELPESDDEFSLSNIFPPLKMAAIKSKGESFSDVESISVMNYQTESGEM